MSADAFERTTDPTRVSATTLPERILQAIQDGSLVDERGRLPSERMLARRFATSRTTIREALLHLCAQGVLQLNNRSRARVQIEAVNTDFCQQIEVAAPAMLKELSGIAQFQQFRAFFECGLVRHAARLATPTQMGSLTKAFLDNRRALGKSQPFIDTDMQFHQVLAEIPGNAGFVVLHTELRSWMAEQRRLGLTVRDSDEHAFKGHQEIMAAIGNRDPDAAERAMAKHLLDVSAHYGGAPLDSRRRGLRA